MNADIVIDKGLLDVFLCGDGWDSNVKKLLENADRALTLGGVYVLISYQLAPATRQFLCENTNWTWAFDGDPGTRSSISIAQKVQL